MDAPALQAHAAELEGLVADLEAALGDTPDVLVRPTLEKAKKGREELLELLAAPRAPQVPAAGDGSQTLRAKSSDISALVATLHEQLADGPWIDPPKLRKMRQTAEALVQSIADVGRQRRKLLSHPVARPLQVPEAPVATYAPAMAGDALVQSGNVTRDGPMDVDEALAMLLEKKQGGYRGGLCGIVHAAGVQEMVPIPAHSPGKFEFVFAPKSAAAFNLHQFSAMI